jgi:hypothetical protein
MQIGKGKYEMDYERRIAEPGIESRGRGFVRNVGFFRSYKFRKRA